MYYREASMITLPFAAFRLSMLCGSLSPLLAGSTNSPLDSQIVPSIESKGTEGFVDYLSVVFTCTNPMGVISRIEKELGVDFRDDIKELVESESGNWYRVRGSFGCCIEFKYRADGDYDVRLVLPGEACRWVGGDKVRCLLKLTRSLYSGRATRLDLTADDYNGILDLSTIRSCLEQGDYHGYRGGEAIQSYGTANAGQSVYFGGRKSLVRLRFYDKKAQSGGKYECTRQELQLRGARAEECVDHILSNQEVSICQYVRSRLSGAIVFGVRKGKNLERTVVADFWEVWQTLLVSPPVRKSSIPIVRSIERSLDWFARTASRTIAKLTLAMGDSEVSSLLQIMVRYGRARLGAPDIHECSEFSKIYDGGDFNERILAMEMFG